MRALHTYIHAHSSKFRHFLITKRCLYLYVHVLHVRGIIIDFPIIHRNLFYIELFVKTGCDVLPALFCMTDVSLNIDGAHRLLETLYRLVPSV